MKFFYKFSFREESLLELATCTSYATCVTSALYLQDSNNFKITMKKIVDEIYTVYIYFTVLLFRKTEIMNRDEGGYFIYI